MTDLADLERLRSTLIDMRTLINDKRTPSGVRRRATRALADTAIEIADVALARLRDRQQADQEQTEDMLV